MGFYAAKRQKVSSFLYTMVFILCQEYRKFEADYLTYLDSLMNESDLKINIFMNQLTVKCMSSFDKTFLRLVDPEILKL